MTQNFASSFSSYIIIEKDAYITVTLQKWWMGNLGNAMTRNMKIRPGRNPYGLILEQSAQHLQKNVIPSLWQFPQSPCECGGWVIWEMQWQEIWKSLWTRFSTICTTPAEKCHSFTVTMFHSHPTNVVDEQFGKCNGEKYETPAREKSLKTGFSTICTPPAGKWLLRPE